MDNEALVRMVGGDVVETVVSHDIIGRLMIQCARQPGLATVWEQLMGFDGGCSHDGLQGPPFIFTLRLERNSISYAACSWPSPPLFLHSTTRVCPTRLLMLQGLCNSVLASDKVNERGYK